MQEISIEQVEKLVESLTLTQITNAEKAFINAKELEVKPSKDENIK